MLAAAFPLWLPLTCPLVRLFITPEKRALLELKNRTTQPDEAAFEPAATLAALLAPGEDRQRWSHDRAASVEGVVVAVQTAGFELANCFSLTRRDTHLDLAIAADAPPASRLIVEVTPPMRDWARAQGLDWSTAALRDLIGRRVRVDGWLLFDWEHEAESENSRPGQPGNWRATAWELHPVTAIAPR